MEWLEQMQDRSLEEIAKLDADTAGDNDPNAEPPALKPGEVPRSLVCSDCGKRFRSEAQAGFHAEKSGHENFEQSQEEIAPLTDEEKKERLAELRAKLAAKRGEISEQDKMDKKKNEVCSAFSPCLPKYVLIKFLGNPA